MQKTTHYCERISKYDLQQRVQDGTIDESCIYIIDHVEHKYGNKYFKNMDDSKYDIKGFSFEDLDDEVYVINPEIRAIVDCGVGGEQ